MTSRLLLAAGVTALVVTSCSSVPSGQTTGPTPSTSSTSPAVVTYRVRLEVTSAANLGTAYISYTVANGRHEDPGVAQMPWDIEFNGTTQQAKDPITLRAWGMVEGGQPLNLIQQPRQLTKSLSCRILVDNRVLAADVSRGSKELALCETPPLSEWHS